MDLSDLESVKNCGHEIMKKYSRIDILINNAGVLGNKMGKTKQGFITCFGTNYLGHFLLTKLLMENIRKSEDGRYYFYWQYFEFFDNTFIANGLSQFYKQITYQINGRTIRTGSLLKYCIENAREIRGIISVSRYWWVVGLIQFDRHFQIIAQTPR